MDLSLAVDKKKEVWGVLSCGDDGMVGSELGHLHC